MTESRTLRDVMRRFGTKRMLAINLVLFGLAAWAFSGEYMRDRDARAEVEGLVAQGDEIQRKNHDRIAELHMSAAEAEGEARLKLNLKRPGEEVVVVKGSSQRVLGGEVSDAPTSRDGNAARWWKLFFE